MDGFHPLQLHFIKSEADGDDGKMVALFEIRSEVPLTTDLLKEVKWFIKVKDNREIREIRPLWRLYAMSDCMKTIQFGFELLAVNHSYQITVKYRGEHIASSPRRIRLPQSTGTVDFTAIKSWKVQASLKSLDVCMPWGGCVLGNGNFVVSTVKEQLKMYDQNLVFIKDIECEEGGGISKPADLTALSNGNFAVKDNTGIRVLDPEGKFLLRVYSSRHCYGIAEDDQNQLWFIEVNKIEGKLTPLLIPYDLRKSQVVPYAISLDFVIGDTTRSKCRFLTFRHGRLYISDLGLDKIYILNPRTEEVELVEAKDRVEEEQSWSGLEVDSLGNILLADYKNDRLCIFDRERNWLKEVFAERPSSVVLDRERGQLLVLCLNGRKSVKKYNLSQ